MIRFVQTTTLAALLTFGVAVAQPVLPDGTAPEADVPVVPAPPTTPAPPGPSTSEDASGAAVDELLARLAKTDDAEAAKRIAGAVQALWLRSGSDTADLLTSRAMEAQRKQKTDMALKLLDQVVGIRPDFAEGWNRRATIHFLAKDYDQAMADIHETLIREPRHFGAWVGLGRILRESGLNRQALGAYRRALAVYPAIDGLKRETDELTVEVEGRPI